MRVPSRSLELPTLTLPAFSSDERLLLASFKDFSSSRNRNSGIIDQKQVRLSFSKKQTGPTLLEYTSMTPADNAQCAQMEHSDADSASFDRDKIG